jgi:predicted transposase YbfD/YdcC
MTTLARCLRLAVPSGISLPQKTTGSLYFYFQSNPNVAVFTQTGNGEHGRIETRKIWVTTKLNPYPNFPHVSQAFMIERESIDKKTGKTSQEVVDGITSTAEDQASPVQILADNRGHWRVESSHHIIDWNYGEERCQFRTGFGPENITRLRRFAIGLLKSKKSKKSNETMPKMMQRLLLNTRAVFDYLKMTRNSNQLSTELGVSVDLLWVRCLGHVLSALRVYNGRFNRRSRGRTSWLACLMCRYRLHRADFRKQDNDRKDDRLRVEVRRSDRG